MFSAAVPDLQWANARVQANSTATFLEISGQKINELAAETTYSQQRLDFTGTAKEGSRRADGWRDGSSFIRTTTRSTSATWPCGPSRLNGALRQEHRPRSATRRTVSRSRRVQLVNGEQRMTAGRRDRWRRLHACGFTPKTSTSRSWTRSCSATGGWPGDSPGTRRSPAPSALQTSPRTFTLSQGAFRTFKFESLTGTVDYTRSGVAMDVRLQQTPAAWIHGEGHRACQPCFWRPLQEWIRTTRTGSAASSTCRFASSQIDLGLIRDSRRM
jgi:hypothetical protein